MFEPFSWRGFFQWVVAGFAFGAGWLIANNILALIGRLIAQMLA